MGDLVSKVHEMAASFVKCRTKEFLTTFLTDSGALDDLYKAYGAQLKDHTQALSHKEFSEKIIAGYTPMFGHLIGIAYALGYADHLQGKSYQELYVPESCL